MADILINQCALDYLTLTSFRRSWYDKCRELISTTPRVFGEWSRKSRLENYRGNLWDTGTFIGVGEQNEVMHHLMRLSGETADGFLKHGRLLVATGWYLGFAARCTRIDIQVTHVIDTSWDARVVSGIWQDSGVNARLVEGGNGMDTIYIGSQKSAYYWRVYVKEDMLKNRYLRWELQLNKDDDHSIEAWSSITREWVKPSNIMEAYAPQEGLLVTGDKEYDTMVEKFRKSLGGGYSKPRRVRNSDFLRWLNGQVRQALKKRVNGHEDVDGIRKWLSEMTEMFGGTVTWNDE